MTNESTSNELKFSLPVLLMIVGIAIIIWKIMSAHVFGLDDPSIALGVFLFVVGIIILALILYLEYRK